MIMSSFFYSPFYYSFVEEVIRSVNHTSLQIFISYTSWNIILFLLYLLKVIYLFLENRTTLRFLFTWFLSFRVLIINFIFKAFFNFARWLYFKITIQKNNLLLFMTQHRSWLELLLKEWTGSRLPFLSLFYMKIGVHLQERVKHPLEFIGL